MCLVGLNLTLHSNPAWMAPGFDRKRVLGVQADVNGYVFMQTEGWVWFFEKAKAKQTVELVPGPVQQ